MNTDDKRVCEALIERGLVTQAQVDRCAKLREEKYPQRTLLEVLVAQGMISWEELDEARSVASVSTAHAPQTQPPEAVAREPVIEQKVISPPLPTAPITPRDVPLQPKVVADTPSEPPAKRSKAWIWIVVAAIVIIAAGGAYYLLRNNYISLLAQAKASKIEASTAKDNTAERWSEAHEKAKAATECLFSRMGDVGEAEAFLKEVEGGVKLSNEYADLVGNAEKLRMLAEPAGTPETWDVALTAAKAGVDCGYDRVGNAERSQELFSHAEGAFNKSCDALSQGMRG